MVQSNIIFLFSFYSFSCAIFICIVVLTRLCELLSLLPADCCEAANCRYCFYSEAKNHHFRPARAAHCTDSREKLAQPRGIRVRLVKRNFTSIGAPPWEAAPKSGKCSLFGKDSLRRGETFNRFLQ